MKLQLRALNFYGSVCHMRCCGLLFLWLALLLSPCAAEDEITLRNGQRVHGKIVQESEDSIFNLVPPRTVETLVSNLLDRGDPELMFSVVIHVDRK